jgi:hypothetical protein
VERIGKTLFLISCGPRLLFLTVNCVYSSSSLCMFSRVSVSVESRPGLNEPYVTLLPE